jgi:hypothetical protein
MIAHDPSHQRHSERQIQYDHGNRRVPIVKLNLALKCKQSRSLVLEDDIVAIDHGKDGSISVYRHPANKQQQ